jgi:hypothetical protein
MEPTPQLDPDEEKIWTEIQSFRFTHPSRRGQVANFFWKLTIESFKQRAFVSSCILAGIAAELAHKAKLCEEDVNMRKRDGRYKTWAELIRCDEKDSELQKMATSIKDTYRNMWVHANLEEIETFLKQRAGFKSSDAEMNVALASGMVLAQLSETKSFLSKLLQATGKEGFSGPSTSEET